MNRLPFQRVLGGRVSTEYYYLVGAVNTLKIG